MFTFDDFCQPLFAHTQSSFIFFSYSAKLAYTMLFAELLFSSVYVRNVWAESLLFQSITLMTWKIYVQSYTFYECILISRAKQKKKWNSYIFTRSKTAIEEKYFCLDFFHFLSKKNYFIIWTLNVFFSPVVVFFMKHNAFAWLWFLCVCCRSTGKITRNLSIQRDFVTDESYLGSVIFYTAGKKGK